MLYARRLLLRPALIIGILLLMHGVLGASLVWLALSPRPIRVIPSARAQETLWPGVVPDGAVREFALRYVLHFDNYTPSTIEASQKVVLEMVSARSWSGAKEALQKRNELVAEGRMASQVIPLSVRVDGRQVHVEALRRTFVGDRLSREARFQYVVTVEEQAPTVPNPFGLAVVSQVIEEVEP